MEKTDRIFKKKSSYLSPSYFHIVNWENSSNLSNLLQIEKNCRKVYEIWKKWPNFEKKITWESWKYVRIYNIIYKNLQKKSKNLRECRTFRLLERLNVPDLLLGLFCGFLGPVSRPFSGPSLGPVFEPVPGLPPVSELLFSRRCRSKSRS